MKLPKKTMFITAAACLAPMLLGLLLWGRLPDTMATHFASDGTPNGWSSKAFAVFGLPGFVTLCHLFCVAATMMDPKRRNIQPKLFILVLWICPVVSWFAGGFTYLYALGIPMNIALWANVLVGVVFLVVGNFMPKMRQNYTMGIKLPWTLSDEDNWDRTHRLAGWLWMAGGGVILLTGLAGIAHVAIMLGVVAVMTLIPAVYSYLYYRSCHKEEV